MNYKFLLVPVFLLFFTSFLFAAAECITPIPDVFNAGEPCVDGYQTDHPRWCSYSIEPAAAEPGNVVIEVTSGGRYGSDRDMYINYDKPNTLNIWLDRETKPIYINCYESRAIQATDGSKGWQKENLLQQVSAVSDPDRYVSVINPEDQAAKALSLMPSELSNISSSTQNIATSIDDLPNNFNDFNVSSSYVNITDVYPDSHYFVGGAFFAVGLFGMLFMLIKLFVNK